LASRNVQNLNRLALAMIRNEKAEAVPRERQYVESMRCEWLGWDGAIGKMLAIPRYCTVGSRE
jgi:hypothetical protein